MRKRRAILLWTHLLIIIVSVLFGAFAALLLTFVYSLFTLGLVGSLAWILMIPILVWSTTKLLLLLTPLVIATVYLLRHFARGRSWYIALPSLYALAFGLFNFWQWDWFLSLIITVYYGFFAISFAWLWFKLLVDPSENHCKILFSFLLPLPIEPPKKPLNQASR